MGINSLHTGLLQSLPNDITIEDVAVVLPSELDFRTFILKLKARNYDAVGAFLLPGQVSSFYRQLRELQYNTKTFGIDTLESENEIKASGSAINGAFFPSYVPSEEFQNKYSKKYNNKDQIHWAGYGYDFATLVQNRICNTATAPLNADEIMQILKTVSGEGVNGKYSFVESAEGDKYFSFPVVRHRAKITSPIMHFIFHQSLNCGGSSEM